MHFRIMLWKSKIIRIKIRTYLLIYIWSKMLSSSLDTLSKLSKTTYPQKLFANDCVTLYMQKKNMVTIKTKIYLLFISSVLMLSFFLNGILTLSKTQQVPIWVFKKRLTSRVAASKNRLAWESLAREWNLPWSGSRAQKYILRHTNTVFSLVN